VLPCRIKVYKKADQGSLTEPSKSRNSSVSINIIWTDPKVVLRSSSDALKRFALGPKGYVKGNCAGRSSFVFTFPEVLVGMPKVKSYPDLISGVSPYFFLCVAVRGAQAQRGRTHAAQRGRAHALTLFPALEYSQINVCGRAGGPSSNGQDSRCQTGVYSRVGPPYINWGVPGCCGVPYIGFCDFCEGRGGRQKGISGLEMGFRSLEVHSDAQKCKPLQKIIARFKLEGLTTFPEGMRAHSLTCVYVH
jgi:hypothetical protein